MGFYQNESLCQLDFLRLEIDFQLWSVSGFTDTALALLKKAKEETKKYEIEYYERDQMLAIAKKSGDQHFVEIMNEHFSPSK